MTKNSENPKKEQKWEEKEVTCAARITIGLYFLVNKKACVYGCKLVEELGISKSTIYRVLPNLVGGGLKKEEELVGQNSRKVKFYSLDPPSEKDLVKSLETLAWSCLDVKTIEEVGKRKITEGEFPPSNPPSDPHSDPKTQQKIEEKKKKLVKKILEQEPYFRLIYPLLRGPNQRLQLIESCRNNSNIYGILEKLDQHNFIEHNLKTKTILLTPYTKDLVLRLINEASEGENRPERKSNSLKFLLENCFNLNRTIIAFNNGCRERLSF